MEYIIDMPFLELFYRLLILIPIILLHEFGHLITALLCGIKVEAFSIGFGKILVHKQLWGIDWRISLLPLGGYCQLAGMTDKRPDGFLAKRYIKKFIVLISGVFMNFLSIIICYLVVYKSIRIGLKVDLEFIKILFLKNYPFNYEFWRFIKIVYHPSIMVFYFTSFSLLCGLSNLLPIPLLDGGHLWTVWLERHRKVQEFCYKMGIILLILLHVAFFTYILK